MAQLLQSILDQVRPTTVIDIGITALLIYWLFSLIRGTRAVSLVIGVSVLFAVYAAVRASNLRLLTQILQTLAVVGLFALVVVFQPELRRALDRIGRVGSFNWLFSPSEARTVDRGGLGPRHRAALGITEQTDAVVIVVSEENGQVSLVERARIVRNLSEPQLAKAIRALLAPDGGRRPIGRRLGAMAERGGR